MSDVRAYVHLTDADQIAMAESERPGGITIALGPDCVVYLTADQAATLRDKLNARLAQVGSARIHDLTQARGARNRPNGDAA